MIWVDEFPQKYDEIVKEEIGRNFANSILIFTRGHGLNLGLGLFLQTFYVKVFPLESVPKKFYHYPTKI